jgi:hypothetical protein
MTGVKATGMPSWTGFLTPHQVQAIYDDVKARAIDAVAAGVPKEWGPFGTLRKENIHDRWVVRRSTGFRSRVGPALWLCPSCGHFAENLVKTGRSNVRSIFHAWDEERTTAALIKKCC